MPIGFSRVDTGRNKTWLVRGIREFLGLKRYAISHAVQMPMLAYKRAIQEITGVELEARLRGKNLQNFCKHFVRTRQVSIPWSSSE